MCTVAIDYFVFQNLVDITDNLYNPQNEAAYNALDEKEEVRELFNEGEGISLSTIVLNSRDWSEILWLPEISRFKINLAIGFIRKKPTGMHWLGYNDAVSWLNEAKTRIFQPTANFEIFEIYLYLVCLPASLP